MKKNTQFKLQLSFFGDYSKVKPTQETIRLCFENLFSYGFLPGSNIQEIDPSTGKLEPRLTLQSISTGIQANVLNGRIDFFALTLPGNPGQQTSVDGFTESVVNVVKTFTNMLSLSFTRVGFVTERFVGEFDAASMTTVRNRLVQPALVVFPELEVSDWNYRIAQTENLSGPLAEVINTTYSISSSLIQMGDQNSSREFETFHVTVDINTPADKKISNLPIALDQFISYAKMRESQIIERLGSIIHE